MREGKRELNEGERKEEKERKRNSEREEAEWKLITIFMKFSSSLTQLTL